MNWQAAFKSNPLKHDRIAVVRLDNARFGSGPGTVIEVSSEPVQAILQRYTDRDGARDSRLRFWAAPIGVNVGERVESARLVPGTGKWARANPTQRYELKGSDAIFRLRDYLTPGGRYPYEDLAKDMSKAHKSGLFVYLYSVPGHLMVSAGHYGKQAKPWCIGVDVGGARMKCFRTAAEAIRGR